MSVYLRYLLAFILLTDAHDAVSFCYLIESIRHTGASFLHFYFIYKYVLHLIRSFLDGYIIYEYSCII